MEQPPKKNNITLLWLVVLTAIQAVQIGILIHVITIIYNRI